MAEDVFKVVPMLTFGTQIKANKQTKLNIPNVFILHFIGN